MTSTGAGSGEQEEAIRLLRRGRYYLRTVTGESARARSEIRRSNLFSPRVV